MQFLSAQEICIILLVLSKHPCSGCCSACRGRRCICSLAHFGGACLQGLLQGLALPGAAQCPNCRDLHSGQRGMNRPHLQEILVRSNWVKSRANPATNHQCEKVACISAAPSFMYYKVVLKRACWDPGVSYTKFLLHTVCKWWEWRTGRHSWKKLYQGTLTGNVDYSTGYKSDRHHGYLSGQLRSH